MDNNLLHKIIQLTEKHPLSIVCAGAYHSSNIEKWLLSNFPEFEKDTKSSITLPGLKCDNLFAIKYPTNVPDSFMNKSMENFLTISKE